MKNLMVLGFLVAGLMGCGSGTNNNPATTTANQCGANMVLSGTTCVPVNSQNCTVGNVWNGTSCVPQAQYNTQYNNGQYPNNTTGVNSQYPQQQYPQQYPQTQTCPAGQYFNGAVCAAIIAQNNGNCQTGQYNTQQYGCAQVNKQCQTQYSYLVAYENVCMPATITPVVSYDTDYLYTTATRSNCQGRRSGCGGCSSHGKIKYRSGPIKKIKW